MRELNEQKLRSFLKRRFHAYRDDIRADESLDGVVDSLGMFELVAFTEETFMFALPNEEFHPSKFSSIRRILDTIEEYSKDHS